MFASNGGPIILAQVENEYGWLEKAYGLNGTIYANWSIAYAHTLDVGVPWNMCAQDNQPTAINTCNGFYCDQWLAQHFETFPDQPALWTESKLHCLELQEFSNDFPNEKIGEVGSNTGESLNQRDQQKRWRTQY